MKRMKRTIAIGDDTLNSREIEERINELEELSEAGELDEADTEELALWHELKEESERYGWEYGILFINDDYFREYAQELAEDIGAIDRNANWPLGCIDWNQAADALQIDYTSAELDGITYWFREA